MRGRAISSSVSGVVAASCFGFDLVSAFTIPKQQIGVSLSLWPTEVAIFYTWGCFGLRWVVQVEVQLDTPPRVAASDQGNTPRDGGLGQRELEAKRELRIEQRGG